MIVSHATLLDAIQPQPFAAVTPTVPVDAAAPNEAEVAVNEYVQPVGVVNEAMLPLLVPALLDA